MIFLLTVTCRSGTAGDRELTGHAHTNLNIFAANSMECEGWVTAWEFYSISSGQIYLGLWDYNPDGHTFTLMGKNLVTVGSADSGQSKVCKEQCVCVCVCVCVCLGFTACEFDPCYDYCFNLPTEFGKLLTKNVHPGNPVDERLPGLGQYI